MGALRASFRCDGSPTVGVVPVVRSRLARSRVVTVERVVTMIYKVTSDIHDSVIVVEAAGPSVAVAWAAMITMVKAGWLALPIVRDTPDDLDIALEQVDEWWGEYCDHADGNDSVSDDEFDSVLDQMGRTQDAIWDGYDYCGS